MDSAMDYNTFWLMWGSGFVIIIVLLLWHIDFISSYADDIRPDTSNLPDVTKRLHKQIDYDFNTNFNSNTKSVESWVKTMFVDDSADEIDGSSVKKGASTTFTSPYLCMEGGVCKADDLPISVGTDMIASSINTLLSGGLSISIDSNAVYHIAEDYFISEGTVTVKGKGERGEREDVKTVNTLTKYTLERRTNLIKDMHVYVDRQMF